MTIERKIQKHSRKLVIGGLLSVASAFGVSLGGDFVRDASYAGKPEAPAIVKKYSEAEKTLDETLSVRDLGNPEILQGHLDSLRDYDSLSNDPSLTRARNNYEKDLSSFNESHSELCVRWDYVEAGLGALGIILTSLPGVVNRSIALGVK